MRSGSGGAAYISTEHAEFPRAIYYSDIRSMLASQFHSRAEGEGRVGRRREDGRGG